MSLKMSQAQMPSTRGLLELLLVTWRPMNCQPAQVKAMQMPVQLTAGRRVLQIQKMQVWRCSY